MALSKLFDRIFWHNNATPAINEDNLNAMSKAIDDIDDRVIVLGDDVLTIVPQIQTYLEQAEDLVEAMENLSKHPPYIGNNGNWFVWDTNTSAFVDSEIDASITVNVADITMIAYGQTPYVTNTGTNTDPVFHLFLPAPSGINNIAKSGTSGLVDTYTITFDDGTTSSFNVTNGADGADGVGIVSIAKTGTSGLVDTYTITYTNGNTSTFTVTNGQDGTGGSIDALTDTNIDTQTLDTGNVLIYDATTGKWKNGQVDVSNKMDKTNPTGTGSFSLNRQSGTTVGANSFAEGDYTTASGQNSHAEGRATTASALNSHAEGDGTTASGSHSHAEGRATIASGNSSHTEGYNTKASGTYSHTEGCNTTASGIYSHTEGCNTIASDTASHAEGHSTTASGSCSHAGGYSVTAYRLGSFAHGNSESSYNKFRGSAMSENGNHCFGFDMSGEEWTADTEVTNSQNGCEGTILDTATVTLSLDVQGMYLLFCSSYTISSGAIYGATARMIVAHGLSTGTPTNLSLGQTSNAPATIAMAANNKITIKNAAAARATQFSLMRIN